MQPEIKSICDEISEIQRDLRKMIQEVGLMLSILAVWERDLIRREKALAEKEKQNTMKKRRKIIKN